MPIGNIWSGISFRHDDSIFVALAEPWSALIGASVSVSAGEEQQKLPVLLPCRVSPHNSGSKWDAAHVSLLGFSNVNTDVLTQTNLL